MLGFLYKLLAVIRGFIIRKYNTGDISPPGTYIYIKKCSGPINVHMYRVSGLIFYGKKLGKK